MAAVWRQADVFHGEDMQTLVQLSKAKIWIPKKHAKSIKHKTLQSVERIKKDKSTLSPSAFNWEESLCKSTQMCLIMKTETFTIYFIRNIFQLLIQPSSNWYTTMIQSHSLWQVQHWSKYCKPFLYFSIISILPAVRTLKWRWTAATHGDSSASKADDTEVVEVRLPHVEVESSGGKQCRGHRGDSDEFTSHHDLCCNTYT